MAPERDVSFSGAGRTRTFLFYAAMVVIALGVFLLIRSAGEGLTAAPSRQAAPQAAGQTIDTLFRALLALAVIVMTARGVGGLFGLIGQPAVIGEVVGGIMLGPSLLGRVAPHLHAQLLPSNVTSFLSIYAQLGVILYLFLVGLDLDLRRVIRKTGHITLAISHASIIVPFLLGSALALVLYPILAASDVRFTVFALFLGVSMSVTAFPVLARILTDQQMSRSRMGALALTCAAIDDVTAWCLLALVVSIAQARPLEAVRTVALTVVFVAIVLQVVAPIVRRLIPRIDRSEDLTRTGLSIVLIAMLASAMTTEYIGIHGFFGAFLFGAIIPHDSRIATELHRRLHDFVSVLFLPAFFAYTGMRTEIGLVSGLGDWLLCAAIILVACLGKGGGTLVASRLSGLSWRDSAALGVLMNTRGLVELIVLNMGLDLGIPSPKLFTMLVIMALVTTVMTTPVLRLLLRKHPWTEQTRFTAVGGL